MFEGTVINFKDCTSGLRDAVQINKRGISVIYLNSKTNYLIMEEIKIRGMKISDIPKIIQIGKSVEEFRVDSKIKGFWSKKQLENWIKSDKDVLLIAEKNNKIIGFVLFAHHVPTGKVTLENAWIDKDFRGKDLIEKLTNAGGFAYKFRIS